MSRIVIHDYWGDHVQPWLSGMVSYFESEGAQVEIWTRKTFRFRALEGLKRPQSGLRGRIGLKAIKRQLGDVEHVYMWNGQNDHHQIVRGLCAEMGIPCSILEVGYFPQSKWFTIDQDGINATASLMRDQLDWVDDEHLKSLAELRDDYLGERKWRGGDGSILVPLQLARDTNVRDHSEVEDMQDLINLCEERFDGEQLRFKLHPRDESSYTSRHPIVREGAFLDMAVTAERVVGLNSTCLLEAVLLGAPTEALGDGFLRAHAGREERLLAALVDKQVPVGETEIEYWISKYSAPKSSGEPCG